MAAQQVTPSTSNQSSLSTRLQNAPSSNEMFRPPAINDIPELSKENLLNMLNQIPDLKGRQFNIEYAAVASADGYPIPFNLDPAVNSYPEPVVIDKLPNNVIQHVKSSNNTALTVALEATIEQEKRSETAKQTDISTSKLNMQPAAVMQHMAQPPQQVQQSRPVSSDESDSSTEASSSESSSSSSSEESDSD